MTLKTLKTLKTLRTLRPHALVLAVLLSATACTQPRLAAGDLLFTVVADTATAHDLSAAIVKATSHASAPQIDHVGIVCPDRGKLHVLEATPDKGVRLCPLDTFLFHADHSADGKPLVLVGRITVSFDKRTSLRRAKAFVGRHYDDVYSPTDDDIYCSELVQKSYVDHKGNLIFSPEPMSFHDADGNVLPYWTEFYRSRGLIVPEGEPGSNPSALARHPAVRIIGQFFCERQ
ncbi:MAG: hypothetical protein IK011_01475 [Bacteroidaceae bacterium]|nr:hypothetical protein [Bacteroidaceae bacterium]